MKSAIVWLCLTSVVNNCFGIYESYSGEVHHTPYEVFLQNRLRELHEEQRLCDYSVKCINVFFGKEKISQTCVQKCQTHFQSQINRVINAQIKAGFVADYQPQ